MAKFAPASNTRVPSDFRRVENEPGVSQDDVHRGSLQYQKGDSFLMQIADLESQRWSAVIHPPTS